MRFTSITLTCLCLVMTAIPAFALEKEFEKQSDSQAMMEMYKPCLSGCYPHPQQ